MGELGLDSKGTKSELILRLEKYLNEQGSCIMASNSVHVVR